MTFVVENFTQQIAYAEFIVHHQNICHVVLCPLKVCAGFA
jgi:hypothetical protein